MLSLPSLKERPVINSIFMPSTDTPVPRNFDLRTLLWWVKKTPECIGIGKRISNDIVTPFRFTAVEKPISAGRPSGTFKKDKEDKAMAFANRNLLKHKLLALVLDWAFTGDFYLWKGRITDQQIKEIAMKHYKEYGLEIKEIDTKQFFDEDPNAINSVEIVPASGMKIFHDDFEVTKYEQWVKSRPGDKRRFTPEEIIHGKYMEIDGSLYGFSPVESSFVAIRTINAIQDYNWYYFQNGAKIDRVWKFMGNPGTEYIEKFKEDIKQYISVKNSHGHLVLAGADKIESEALNEISEEMEYRKLAINSVGRLAFAFNMPADTLSPILGTDIRAAAGSSDVEDAGYNRNIERAQEYIEDLLNTQLFIPEFQVKIRFERQFRQDQIRQIQYMAMAVPVVDYLIKRKFPVTDTYLNSLLQIDRTFLDVGKIDRTQELGQEVGQVTKANDDFNKGEASKAAANQKKNQQKTQQNNNPPLGS